MTMTTTKETVEVLASRSGHGAYGFAWESRLVRHGDKHYLVDDSFCGMGDPEGGRYRPFLYLVPEERVEEIRGYFEHADELINETTTEWSYFQQMVLGDLHCMGRKSMFAWATDL